MRKFKVGDVILCIKTGNDTRLVLHQHYIISAISNYRFSQNLYVHLDTEDDSMLTGCFDDTCFLLDIKIERKKKLEKILK